MVFKYREVKKSSPRKRTTVEPARSEDPLAEKEPIKERTESNTGSYRTAKQKNNPSKERTIYVSLVFLALKTKRMKIATRDTRKVLLAACIKFV